MEQFVDILTNLSSIVGVPVVLCLAWAAFIIRDHERRIKKVEEHIKELEEALAEQADKRTVELNAIYERINGMSENLSYITGVISERYGKNIKSR